MPRENEYCPCGSSEWVEVKNTTLYSNYFYCPKCGKTYQQSISELTKEEVNQHFYSDRHSEMVSFAKQMIAMKKVTFKDLQKLGYLE